MNKFVKLILGAALLTPMVTACSSSDDESGDEWILPDDNNSTVFVEFDAYVKDFNGGSQGTTLDKFMVYGFNSALGNSVFGNTKSTTPQGVEVTRNRDDQSMWDYVGDPATNGMLKWATLLKYPISFYGIGGDGASMASLGTKNKLPTLKVEMPVGNDGVVDARNTHDLLFADALLLDPRQYLNDSTKVSLEFGHILPLMQLRATLAQASDLEVTIQSATIIGLVSAAEYDFNEVNPSWTAYTPGNGVAKANVALPLATPVVVTESLADLQDNGAYIIPQTVKAWTSAANNDGAGIKLMARIRSKASNTYLAGSANAFSEVYVAIDDASFVSGNIYTLEITFNSIYNADGSIGYRASYKPVVTPWVEKEDNLVLQ